MLKGLVVVTAALAGAAPAVAAPAIGPPKPIGQGIAPDVAIAADGSAFVAWSAADGGTVLASRRAPGAASFIKPERLAASGVVAGSVRVAREAGAAAVVWTEDTGGATRVKVTVAAPVFGEPETIEGASEPSVVLLPSGAVLVGARRGGQAVTALKPPGGPLGAAQTLVSADTPARVAVGGGGFRAVANDGGKVVAFEAGPDAAFGQPVTLSAADRPAQGAVTLAGSRFGELVAAWRSAGAVEAAVRPAAGGWEPAAPLGLGEATDLRAGVGDAGDAAVAWQAGAAALSFRPRGGAFTPPVAGPAAAPADVGVDVAGGTMLTRIAPDGLVANLRERDGGLGGDVRVSLRETGVTGGAVATDLFGNAVIAYASTELANPVSTATYSRSAPALDKMLLRKGGLRVDLSEPARLNITVRRPRDGAEVGQAALVPGGRSVVDFRAAVRKLVARKGRYGVTVRVADSGPQVEVKSRRLRRR